MSKGAKMAIGIAAAVAIPFAAPAIAGVIGLSGAVGSALVGAGLGGAAGYATTGTAKGALMGAGLGGLGGFVGGGGAAGLFGGGAGAAAVPTTGVVAPTGAGAQTASWLAGTTVTPAATGVTSALGAAAPVATTAATTGGFGLSSIPVGDVAKLALTLFNKPSTDLTAAEQQQLKNLDQIKARSEAAYQQALNDYMALKQQGVPNPEKAFADIQQRIALTSREQERAALTRGLGQEQIAAQRRAANIEATRLGAISTEKEAERAQAAQAAAASARPDPTRMLTLGAAPAQAAIERRNIQDERNWYGQLAQAAGGMFGARKPEAAAPQRAATAGLTPPSSDYTAVSGSTSGLFDTYNYT